jgi:hypothetical protein
MRIFCRFGESRALHQTRYSHLCRFQTAIPVFEDLLPNPHNSSILRLLFHFAHWHGLAKLRMHTDTTTDILDTQTTVLGHLLRMFQSKVCAVYVTHELPREAQARHRRQAKSSSKPTEPRERKRRTFNLQTYKVHSLGDYVDTIKKYGTTDSYSTEPVGVQTEILSTAQLTVPIG